MRTIAAAAALVVLALTIPEPLSGQGGGTPVLGYDVVRSYPHDPEAFTQGLIVLDGVFYESTGLHGRSSLRKVRIETGEVLQRQAVERRFFAEGLAAWGRTLIQLTWQDNLAFVYNQSTFAREDTFTYTGEGWGLTHDGKRLILSDGTSALRFLDPVTHRETGRVTVTADGRAVDLLNELEFIRGEVWANVWMTDRVAIINPSTGRLRAWLNLAGLLPAGSTGHDVLNGIAYDAARDRIYVTGKLWPRVFEIRVRGR